MQHRGTFGYGKNRPNQAALFSICFFGGLAFLSAIALLVCGLVIARPAIWAQEFQITNCTVVRVEHRGDVECSCGSDRNGNDNCFSTYPCVAVHVEYDVTTDEEGDVKSMVAMAHEHETIGIDEGDCTTVPSCSGSKFSNNKTVYEFLDKQGKMNTSYPCLYNPKNFENVIFVRIFTKQHTRIALSIPAVFFAVGIIGSIYAVIALMSKSKLSLQPGGAVDGMPPTYPTNAEVSSYPPPPPLFAAPSYGIAPPPPVPGLQPNTMGAPPPAYSPTPNTYGGFSANYPRMQ